jgi:hypothetical protein
VSRGEPDLVPAVDGVDPARDAPFMALAKRLGLVDLGVKSGHWPDFCRDPRLPYDCKAEAAKLSR